MARVKLTKTEIDRAQPAPHDTYLWDTGVPGFGVRIKGAPKGGAKSFVVQYRIGGRSRRLTLGRYGRLTVEQARKQAQRAFGRIADGADPVEERRAQRHGETVRDLADRYLEQHALPKKKASSIRADQLNLRNHILPRLGTRRVADVTREQVARLHHDMRGTPGAANRTLALLSKMMNLAERWGMRPDGTNPCRHVERYRERKLERFLSERELAQLGAALQRAEQNGTHTPEVVAAIRLLIFTGCRRGEILGLRWDHIDLERRCLRLPDTKTGARSVPLNAPALKILSSLARTSDWVFPGRAMRGPIVNLDKSWRRICAAAGIADLRIHDLRHSFASVGAGAGLSLRLIGALLGHSQAATTQRYAHLANDPLQQASDAIASKIAAAMGGKAGEIVSFPS